MAFPGALACRGKVRVQGGRDHLGSIGGLGARTLLGDAAVGPVDELLHHVEFAFGGPDAQRHRRFRGCGLRGGPERKEVPFLGSWPAAEDQRGQLVGVCAQGVDDQRCVAARAGAGLVETGDDQLVRIGRPRATDKPQVVAVVRTYTIGEFLQRVEPPSSRDRRGRRVIRSGAGTDHGEQDAVDDLWCRGRVSPRLQVRNARFRRTALR
jgi:hypothetical protein